MTLKDYLSTRKDIEKFHAKVQEVVERTVTLRKIKQVTAVDWCSGTHAAVFFVDANGTRDMTLVPVYELEFKED
jgi:hypothetical protein